MTSPSTCPRCGHLIPKDLTPGAYPGCRSLSDGRTEICVRCGIDELTGHGSVPLSQWPIDLTTPVMPRGLLQPADQAGLPRPEPAVR